MSDDLNKADDSPIFSPLTDPDAVPEIPGVTVATEEPAPTIVPEPTVVPTPVPVVEKPTRDQIRTAMLDQKAITRKTPFNGVMVELHQPSLSELLAMQDDSREDAKNALVNSIIAYCFVPDTNERVFEDTDKASLMGMPWGQDLTRLFEAFNELTGVNVTNADKS